MADSVIRAVSDEILASRSPVPANAYFEHERETVFVPPGQRRREFLSLRRSARWYALGGG